MLRASRLGVRRGNSAGARDKPALQFHTPFVRDARDPGARRKFRSRGAMRPQCFWCYSSPSW
eukprot:4170632-Pyramimonas_sp.AAC.1